LLIILLTCLPIKLKADTIGLPRMYVSLSTTLNDNGTSVSTLQAKLDGKGQQSEINVRVGLPNLTLIELQMQGKLTLEKSPMA
jgi:hypothetical protein